jgi:hypothetical protein
MFVVLHCTLLAISVVLYRNILRSDPNDSENTSSTLIFLPCTILSAVSVGVLVHKNLNQNQPSAVMGEYFDGYLQY